VQASYSQLVPDPSKSKQREKAIEECPTSHNANSSHCLCSVCVGDTAHKNHRQSFVLVAVAVLWAPMMAVFQVGALLLFQGKH
jgi:hypothetical protein